MSSLNPKHQAKRVLNLGRRTRRVIKSRLSITKDYIFSIDSPRKKILESRTVTVEGWIIPKQPKDFQVRVRNNTNIYPVKMGVKRLDVAKSRPNLPEEKTLHCGFKVEFEFEDGDLAVEINSGKGYKKLYSTKVRFGVEQLPSVIYNKDLSNNYPEHVNLLENRKKYYYEDRLEGSYVRDENDAKVMAIYLPQFHPFEENDKAWGRGFTEWSNVTTAQPRFIGHQQPILPKDLGFYDLRLESKIQEQIELAKKYGIYGFCFYYYWFSGKKIMDKPLDSFLSHKEWDFNFAICWANENWTKRWDGRDSDVIIAQEYLEDDPINFIKDIEHILLDDRYIQEDGKPVLMVYRASELKEPKKYAEVWRRYFTEKHDRELQLVSYLSFDDQDPREYGFDAALDFSPLSAFFKTNQFKNNAFPYIDVSRKLLDINFSGVVADYRTIALNDNLDEVYDFPTYPCLTPSWDNDARKKGKGFIYQNSSPDLYAAWLERLVRKGVKKQNAPYIFVNAWNEWAEGAIMEPSNHLGHAVLNRTAEVLSSASNNKKNQIKFPKYGLSRNKDTKLAVVIHLYYIDLWPTIKNRLSYIEEPYDLFITLNERDRDFQPELDSRDSQIYTYVIPNRGRDVLPFLYIAQRIRAAGYEYFLKLHSKKSKHRQDGSDWFSDVVTSLLPDSETITKTIECLKQEKTGIIGPRNHLVSLRRHMGSNRLILQDLLSRAYNEQAAKKVLKSPEQYPYFGGTMFWARLDAIDKMLNLLLMPDDFQSEHGQVDGTTAHALERMFGVTVKLEEKRLYEMGKGVIKEVPNGSFDEKYKYAP